MTNLFCIFREFQDFLGFFLMNGWVRMNECLRILLLSHSRFVEIQDFVATMGKNGIGGDDGDKSYIFSLLERYSHIDCHVFFRARSTSR